MSRSLTLALVLAVPLLSGCVAAVVGAGAVTAGALHDRRSFGTVIDDQTIEIAVTDRIFGHRIEDEKYFTGKDRIKVVSHNGLVLLIGRVTADDKIALAGDLAATVDDVREVVNELEVGPTAGIGTRIGDSFLSTKVKTALFDVDIDGFDPTRVNVTTVNDVVYLMGLVTPAEGDAAAREASQVSGVSRVVKVFEYIDPEQRDSEAQPG
ncbi:MAG: division/outer membrane stress-associated lipid-binding lipoprotein [Wenzhouxiangellaceae bacterium]